MELFNNKDIFLFVTYFKSSSSTTSRELRHVVDGDDNDKLRLG